MLKGRQVTHSWEGSNLLGVRCRWWNMFLIPLHNVFFFGNVLSPSTSWTWPRALVYSSGPMLPLHLIHPFSTAPAHVCDYGRPGGSCRPATRGPTAGAARAKLKLLPACEPPSPSSSPSDPPQQTHGSSTSLDAKPFSPKISPKTHTDTNQAMAPKQLNLPMNCASKFLLIGTFSSE